MVRPTHQGVVVALSKRNQLPERRTRTPAAAAAVSSPSSSGDTSTSSPASATATVEGAGVVRSGIASVLWLVAAVCATVLAVAALLVALEADDANAIVSLVKDTAHTLDLGVFSPGDGILTPKHDPQLVKATLVNWGVAAVLYLVVGKIADQVVRR
jgi:hypothetical protein